MIRNWVRLLWVTLFGLTFIGANLVQATQNPSITGTYECVGESGNGAMYKGTVKITKKGDTYLLEWEIGRSKHVGVGIIEKNLLCSSWATTLNGKVIMGIVVYRIENGKLIGRWTQYPGYSKIFKETLTPMT
jgi:hypothetical protein